jgi:hypothetical protein
VQDASRAPSGRGGRPSDGAPMPRGPSVRRPPPLPGTPRTRRCGVRPIRSATAAGREAARADARRRVRSGLRPRSLRPAFDLPQHLEQDPSSPLAGPFRQGLHELRDRAQPEVDGPGRQGDRSVDRPCTREVEDGMRRRDAVGPGVLVHPGSGVPASRDVYVGDRPHHPVRRDHHLHDLGFHADEAPGIPGSGPAQRRPGPGPEHGSGRPHLPVVATGCGQVDPGVQADPAAGAQMALTALGVSPPPSAWARVTRPNCPATRAARSRFGDVHTGPPWPGRRPGPRRHPHR